MSSAPSPAAPGNSSMRICHITTAHPATDPRIFWRECVGLAKLGHAVTLVAQSPRGAEQLQGVQIRPLRPRRSRLRRVALGWIGALIHAVRENADVYHLHDPELIPLLVLLRLSGRTVVYDAHEWLSLQVQAKDYLRGSRQAAAVRIAKALEWTVRRFASEIVTVNESCREPFRPREAVIVANFPDTDLFRPAQTSRDHQETATFVYVGNISIERGLANVINALELVNETTPTRLVLAGPIHRDQVRQQLQRLDGWRHVDYLGAVDYPAIPDVIRQGIGGVSALLPTPNHLISSPIKIYEYLACGLPVIASDFPAWRSSLGRSKTVEFVDPNDPRSIAAAMSRLASDPERTHAMGDRARELALAQFSLRDEIRRLEAAYASVMRLGPRGAAVR